MKTVQYFLLIALLITLGTTDSMGYNRPEGLGFSLYRMPACHVISIGINSYNLGSTRLGFTNSVNDATRLAKTIREEYWRLKLKDLQRVVLPGKKKSYTKEQLKNWNPYPSHYNYGSDDLLVTLSPDDSLKLVSRKDSVLSKWLFQHTLLNEEATGDNILRAFQDVIQKAGPNDTFIFDFSGYSLNYAHAGGYTETIFIPHTKAALSDTTQLIKAGISLRKLREMMEFIKARNQLMVIEAGYGEQFSAELMQLLIESNPEKAEVLDRDRIIVIPSKIGEDYTRCRDSVYQNGPLHHFLISLRQASIFDLFTNKRAVVMDTWRQEMDCSPSSAVRTDALFYTQFIFERDLLRLVIRQKATPKMRGVGVAPLTPEPTDKTPYQRHALLIGTSKYRAADSLKTPLNDIRAVERLLSNEYGFKTKLLANQPKDSIMAQLVRYARTLDSTSQLLIYVAGHGGFDETFGDGYLLFSDSKPIGQDPYRQSYLFYSQLERLLNKTSARQILLVLDVCFGGTFERTIAESAVYRTDPNAAVQESALKANEYAAKVFHYSSRQTISAGGKNEVPDFLVGSNNSSFNLLIQKKLGSRGGDRGWLTASDLYTEVQTLPWGPVKIGFGKHDPRGEFFLIPVPREEPAK